MKIIESQLRRVVRQELKEAKLLQEKQILFNGGADYNQAVFLAGGTGSGKSFASKNFMQAEKFKRFDVDRWKRQFLQLQKQTQRYPELRDLDLGDPEDVTKLHKFIKSKGIHDRFIKNVLKGSEPGRLPNVLFDVTLDEADKLHKYVPMLLETGYRPTNIHLVWVLADYEIAVKRNRSRERVVPEDILLQTHTGAANTITGLVNKGMPSGMDGAAHVILNNPSHTVFYADEDGDPVEVSGSLPGSENVETRKVVKGFKYLTLKFPGGGFRNPLEIKETLVQWIKRNVPKTVETWKKLSTVAG